MYLDITESVVIQGPAECLDKRVIIATLVAAANGVEFKAIDLAESLEPGNVIVGCVLRPEIAVAYPVWRTPCRRVEGDVGVAALRLL